MDELSLSLLLPDGALHQGGLLALLAPRAAGETMLLLSARLAARGPLRVLDAGNRFNAYAVARTLRRMDCPDLDAALERVRVARAFTCYQVAALLSQTPSLPGPTLVIDFLDTFYDQSVGPGERRRLLDMCLGHLQRLSGAAPVVVSLRPPRPPQADPGGLLHVVQAAADRVWFQEELLPAVRQSRLF